MMLVKDIYNKQIIPIYENITIKEELAILIKNHFNCVVVYNQKDELVGIFSIQDVVASIVPIEMQENSNLADAMYKKHFFYELCAKVKDKKVKSIMRKEYIKASLDESVIAVAAEFLNTDLYVFPVIENDKVVGIVTRSELKKALALGMDITL